MPQKQETEVALVVAQSLEALSVPYCVGGSFASTVYGESRSTRDVDVLTALRATHVQPFVQQLGDTFFVQLSEVQEAVLRAPTLKQTPHERATFSILHMPSFFKADIFVSSGRAFDSSQFSRRVSVTTPQGRTLTIASAEDTILAKLEWYRMGHEVSDRQWRDVLSVLSAQHSALDYAYLRQWATTLGVRDLLDRALSNNPPPDPEPQQQSLF